MDTRILRNAALAAGLVCALNAPASGDVECAASTGMMEPQYFATLPFRETPFAPQRGIHPMTAEMAANRNHYRFDYDGCGRVTWIRFRLGETVRDLNDTANYYHHAPQVEVQYRDGKEIRRFFDRHGNGIRSDGDVFTEVYTLDEHGYPERLDFFDEDGQPAANSWGVVRYEWLRREDGVVVETRHAADGSLLPLRPGLPFYTVHFHYGADGWLAVMRNVDAEGNPVVNELNAAQDRLEYTAAGDLLSWNVLDAEGRPAEGNGPAVAHGIIERDAYGYESVERYADASGAAMHSVYGFGYTRASYDRFGNRIERANYTLDGTQLQARDVGYAGYRMEFDPTGLMRTSLELFDETGAPVARADQGWARTEFDHDADGNVIEIRYLDTDGAVIARHDTGYARVLKTYDGRGRLIAREYVDAAGNPVEDRQTGVARIAYTYGEFGFADAVQRFDLNGEVLAP